MVYKLEVKWLVIIRSERGFNLCLLFSCQCYKMTAPLESTRATKKKQNCYNYDLHKNKYSCNITVLAVNAHYNPDQACTVCVWLYIQYTYDTFNILLEFRELFNDKFYHYVCEMITCFCLQLTTASCNVIYSKNDLCYTFCDHLHCWKYWATHLREGVGWQIYWCNANLLQGVL